MNTNAQIANKANNLISKLTEQNGVLCAEINEWKNLFQKATKEAFDLKAENRTLKDNISKLYNTAKTDNDKSSSKIKELESQIDDLLYNQFRSDNNKHKDKTNGEIQNHDNERTKCENSSSKRSKRRSHSRERLKKPSPQRGRIEILSFQENKLKQREFKSRNFNNTARTKHAANPVSKKPLKKKPPQRKKGKDVKNYNHSDKNQVKTKPKSIEIETIQFQPSSSNFERSISPECPF